MKSFIIILALLACVYSATAANIRIKRGLSEDADKILRQNPGLDTNNVGQLVDLVEKNNAEDCLARVICELSSNPRRHGEGGAKFAQSLLKFRQSKHPKVDYYLKAMKSGANSKNGEQCKSHYTKCNYSASEVVVVGNKVLRSK